MANTLASCREELRLLLAAVGVTTYDYVPSRVVPPAVVLSPAGTWIEQGETFCDIDVSFDVIAVAAPVTNETATAELDQLVMDVLDAIDTWSIDGVQAPDALSSGGVDYLSSVITFTTTKEIQTS